MSSSVYEYQPSFILGFHGCDKEVGEAILSGKERHLKRSEQAWDWLGSGIYFWEGNLTRAQEWAEGRKAQGKIKEAFVIGAIIDLGHCLDLFDREAIFQVQAAHELLTLSMKGAGLPMPVNGGRTPDRLNRELDCMVLNSLHSYRVDKKQPYYDSVRGPFLERDPIYEGAGFHSHTHIQICVRNEHCIKGYFRPL